MTPFSIIQKDPADLRPNKAIKDFPRWAKDDPRFYGLCNDIKANGIQTPLRVTADGTVLDGELCRVAARALQLSSVPCVIVPDDEASETILRGLIRRRHLTKGQLAFLAVPLIQPAFEESKRRRLLNDPNHKLKRNEFVSGLSVADYAANMGMSARYLEMVNRLYSFIAENPEPHEFEIDADGETTVKTMTLREWVMLKLFDPEQPQGIGEINKAAGYFVSCWQNPSNRRGGAPKEPDRQMDLFEENFDNQIVRWDYWVASDDKQKLAFFENVKSKVSALPPEQVEDMAEYHEQMARTLRKAAKKVKAEVAS